MDLSWRGGRLRRAAIREAPPETVSARIARERASLRVCCGHDACGTSAEALAAAVGGAVRSVHALRAAVWSWEVRAPWTMRLD